MRLLNVWDNDFSNTVVIATKKLSSSEAKPRCYDNFEDDNNRVVIFQSSTFASVSKLNTVKISNSFLRKNSVRIFPWLCKLWNKWLETATDETVLKVSSDRIFDTFPGATNMRENLQSLIVLFK